MVVDKNAEQIYLKTANLIYDLRYKLKINDDEQTFLLNLLELTVNKKDKPEFLKVLKLWMNSYDDSELDEIIKATLLAIDWSDEGSLQFNKDIVIDLINEKNKLSSGGADTQEV
jgi:hypothetical protein